MAHLARFGARHGTVLTADFQTAGTGREHRPWIAPSGSALLISVLIKTGRTLHDIPVVSLLIGGCVADTLSDFGINSSIKWPNDVLVGGRKIGGILVRSRPSLDSPGLDLVVGIGLNLTPESSAGVPTATNIATEAAIVVDRWNILDRLLLHIGCMCQEFERDEHALRVRSVQDRLAFLGDDVVVLVGANQITGQLEGVRDDGALIVVSSAGQREYVMSGELQRGPTLAQPGR